VGILNSPAPRDLYATGTSARPRHVLLCVDFHNTCGSRSLFCYYYLARTTSPALANVSIIVAITPLQQLARRWETVHYTYCRACIFPRRLRVTADDVIEVTWETHLRSRRTCIYTIRYDTNFSFHNMFIIIATDPDDSTRRVWRRCTYTISAYLYSDIRITRV